MNEVTADEIWSSYDVKIRLRQDTAWVKHITLTNKAGRTFNVRLHWNENDGYRVACDEIFGEGFEEIASMFQRPEFEYVLDSITEDMLNVSVLGGA